jgi:hypothetical protein
MFNSSDRFQGGDSASFMSNGETVALQQRRLQEHGHESVRCLEWGELPLCSEQLSGDTADILKSSGDTANVFKSNENNQYVKYGFRCWRNRHATIGSTVAGMINTQICIYRNTDWAAARASTMMLKMSKTSLQQ